MIGESKKQIPIAAAMLMKKRRHADIFLRQPVSGWQKTSNMVRMIGINITPS